MFSNLGNIFVTKPRQAETTDTYLGIRRHDPDQERRKRKKKKDDHPINFDEGDSATVSLSALRAFLEEFLKSQMAEQKKEAPQAQTDHTDIEPSLFEEPLESRRPATGEGAQAASAYQSQARRHQSTLNQSENTAQVAESLGLRSNEIRTIHTLLEDLKILQNNNIEYLTIERSDSFLNSLVAAVEKHKTGH